MRMQVLMATTRNDEQCRYPIKRSYVTDSSLASRIDVYQKQSADCWNILLAWRL